MKPSLTLKEIRATLDREGRRSPSQQRLGTGFASFDAALGGGLVKVGLNEFLYHEAGCGIHEFLLNVVRREARKEASRGKPPLQVAWVHPELIPYPPAAAQHGPSLARWLFVAPRTPAEQLWALEQILRSGVHQCVMAPMESISDRHLRRLQMAALEGEATAFLLRPLRHTEQSSPSPLRLQVRSIPCESPGKRGLHFEILRCRGVSTRAPIWVEWSVGPLDESSIS